MADTGGAVMSDLHKFSASFLLVVSVLVLSIFGVQQLSSDEPKRVVQGEVLVIIEALNALGARVEKLESRNAK
jgi:hypothetical protein